MLLVNLPLLRRQWLIIFTALPTLLYQQLPTTMVVCSSFLMTMLAGHCQFLLAPLYAFSLRWTSLLVILVTSYQHPAPNTSKLFHGNGWSSLPMATCHFLLALSMHLAF